MTEQKNDETVEIIDQNAIVDIKISSSFYMRLQNVFNSLKEEKKIEEVENAFNQIREQKIEEKWIYDLETMLILLKEFQEKAKEQNATKKISKEELEELIKKNLPEEIDDLKTTEDIPITDSDIE